MRLFLPILLLLPLIEIAGFVIVGGEIGVFSTLALILLTGMAGILLLRRQGFDTLRRAQARMNQGEPPVREVFDGICLALAGVLLIVPGFLTDIIGVLLFLPPVRSWAYGRAHIKVRTAADVRRGGGYEWRGDSQPRYRGPEVIEGEYREVRPADERGPEELPPPDSRWRPPQRD